MRAFICFLICFFTSSWVSFLAHGTSPCEQALASQPQKTPAESKKKQTTRNKKNPIVKTLSEEEKGLVALIRRGDREGFQNHLSSRLAKNINKTDSLGRLLTYYIVKYSRQDFLDMLVGQFDFSKKDKLDYDTFHYAIFFEQWDIADWVLRQNPNQNINTQETYGRTPFFTAVNHNSQKGVEYLFRLKADPLVLNYKKLTALHYLVETSYLNPNDFDYHFFKFLIGKLSPQAINFGDAQKRTPLHYAVSDSRKDLIMDLLEQGADINLRDIYGGLPFHYSQSEDVMRFFLNRSSSDFEINEPDSKGDTLAHYLAKSGNENLLKTLLLKDNYGVDWSLKNNEGKTPLNIIQSNRQISPSLKRVFRNTMLIRKLQSWFKKVDEAIGK